MIATLRHLARTGVLRSLDSAFAAFVTDLDPDTGPALAVAAALLCRVEGHGHPCLPLSELCRANSELFVWPPGAVSDIAAIWRALPTDVAGWLAVLARSRVVQRVGRDADRGEPLVIDGPDAAPRLYLRRYWRTEHAVASAVGERSACLSPVDELAVRNGVDRLFAPDLRADAESAGTGLPPEPDWQRIACAIAVRGRLTIITGGPGTGKTHTAARLLALLFATSPAPERLSIALAAPTGKAAARLRQSIDRSLQSMPPLGNGDGLDLSALTRCIGPPQTLHALLGATPGTRRFRHHAGHRLAADMVIVDEASMIHLEMMAALLAALAPEARLVLIGDRDQLASVEAGAVLGDLCEGANQARYDAETARYLLATTGQQVPSTEGLEPDRAATRQADIEAGAPTALAQQTVMLRHSRRFDGPIGELARAVNDATDLARPGALLRADPSGALFVAEAVPVTEAIALAVGGRPGASASYGSYLEVLRQRPESGDPGAHTRWAMAVLGAFERFRVLCAIRDGEWGVTGLNVSIERALERAGLLRPRGTWYQGRPVMVTRNDPDLGVFNGDVGIALPTAGDTGGLRVHLLVGERLRVVAVSRLAQVETAFAMTVHKSQGSEYEHAALVLAANSGGVLTRELIYTGITRSSRNFSLVSERAGLLEEGMARATRRQSGLLRERLGG